MRLDKMISLFSTVIGFCGAVFMGKGIMKLTPDIMVRQAATIVNHNLDQLDSIAEQRADVESGLWLIGFAFLFQILNLIFVKDFYKPIESRWCGVIVSFIPSILFVWLVFVCNGNLVEKYQYDAHLIIARKTANEYLKSNKLSKQNFKSILFHAKRLFNLIKNDEETDIDFSKRYFKFLNIKLPDNIDLSEIK